MPLKAIIVEDEKHSRETLKNLLENFCEGVTVTHSIATVKDALAILPEETPDVVFMDIELQPGTSFDILSQLEDIPFEVIFTTAFDQYAIKAIKFSSLDYLLKPIDLDELKQALEKVRFLKNKQEYHTQLKVLLSNIKQNIPSRICLATAEGIEFISTDEILFCEAQGAYTRFKLQSKKDILVSKHLKEYESLLQEPHFMRVHNKYLINLKEVCKYVKSEGGYIVMNDGNLISISREKKEAFLNAMQNLNL